MLDKFKVDCADCSHTNVTWAVINRGLLICDQCCSVHRSLGRHISQLKSLSKGQWRPSQLNMVQALNCGSINSFWEHSISDSKQSKKKPQPSDPLHPNKAEFIRAKHQELAFIMKCRNSDSPEDLNQQLHSSVRTSNLETSLRLLIQGADPNYYHQEKGNYALHVAASAGQLEQIELLISYGADPNVTDNNGNDLISCARNHGFPETVEKIIECIYEVSDSLCMFVCNRKPDHKSSHFFVPRANECRIIPVSDPYNLSRLQQLDNAMFEELVMDVYDEVDRRENETIFQETGVTNTDGNNKERTIVPFLPVNPDLSTMRNQGRQKLARLSDKEFFTLIFDILNECKRRQNSIMNGLELASADDEPLYDTVASDDDYVSSDEILANKLAALTKVTGEVYIAKKPPESPEQNSGNDMKFRLLNSETRISELVNQVFELRKKMDEIKKENVELRNTILHRTEQVKDEGPEVKPRPTSLYNIAQQYINSANSFSGEPCQPQPEEVLKKADQVTKTLQELSKSFKSIENFGAFTSSVETIRTAVTELTSIFPQGDTAEEIRASLRSLNTNTIRLHAVCADMDSAIERMRNCAFNLAKANRQILTHFQC